MQYFFVQSVPGIFGWQWNIGLGRFVLLFLYTVPLSWLCSYAYGRLRGWLSPADFSRTKSYLSRPQGLQAP